MNDINGTVTSDRCKECGGKCCKTLVMKRPDYINDILETRVVGMNDEAVWINAACKHLVDGLCSIYEDRPESCRSYPVDGEWCTKTREAVA